MTELLKVENLKKATVHIEIITKHLICTCGKDNLEKVIENINQILKRSNLSAEEIKDLFELVLFINQYQRHPLNNLLSGMKD